MSNLRNDDQLRTHRSTPVLRGIRDATIWHAGVRAAGVADSAVIHPDAAARAVVEAADGARIGYCDVRDARAVPCRVGVQDLGDAVTTGTARGAVATRSVFLSSRYRSSLPYHFYDQKEFVPCSVFTDICYAN